MQQLTVEAGHARAVVKEAELVAGGVVLASVALGQTWTLIPLAIGAIEAGPTNALVVDLAQEWHEYASGVVAAFRRLGQTRVVDCGGRRSSRRGPSGGPFGCCRGARSSC